jgi:hypothetical protein
MHSWLWRWARLSTKRKSKNAVAANNDGHSWNKQVEAWRKNIVIVLHYTYDEKVGKIHHLMRL